MTKLYVNINEIRVAIAKGKKEDMEKLKEKMEKDKDKIKKYKIKKIWVE